MVRIEFGYRWWPVRHMSGSTWFPMQVFSFFGLPLTTFFFCVHDEPCENVEEALDICCFLNDLDEAFQNAKRNIANEYD